MPNKYANYYANGKNSKVIDLTHAQSSILGPIYYAINVSILFDQTNITNFFNFAIQMEWILSVLIIVLDISN